MDQTFKFKKSHSIEPKNKIFRLKLKSSLFLKHRSLFVICIKLLMDYITKLRSLLKETVFGYHATLEPGQLKQILLSNAKQLGYGPDEDVFNAFHNAVESHFKHGPVGLLKQCNKNIMTLIEAQRKSPEIAPPSESQKKPVEGSGLRQEAKEERRTLRLGTC